MPHEPKAKTGEGLCSQGNKGLQQTAIPQLNSVTAAWASMLGMNTLHSCSASKGIQLSECNKQTKKGKNPTSEQSFKRTSLKDVSRAESLHSPFFIFPVQSEVLVFLLCLVAETFLPRYTGKEAAIWHFLPMATNSLSLPSKQLPPIVWKSAVPSFQIHRSQC